MKPSPSKVASRWITSARPVPIDKAYLKREAALMWDRLWRRVLSVVPQDKALGSRRWTRPIAEIDISPLRGGMIKATVLIHAVDGAHWSHGKLSVGGMFSRWETHTGADDRYITINLDGSRTPAYLQEHKARVIKDIYSVLIHEVTHAADVIRSQDRVRPEDDFEGYLNSPHEMRAHMQQIVDEALEVADKEAESMEGFTDTRQLVELGLKGSFTWRSKGKEFNRDSRRKILQAVHFAIDEADLVAKYTPEDDFDDWKPTMPFPDSRL